jgi:hypothetical protein
MEAYEEVQHRKGMVTADAWSPALTPVVKQIIVNLKRELGHVNLMAVESRSRA